MRYWRYTLLFVLLGSFLSWLGYVLVQMMFLPGIILLLPVIPVVKLLGLESALQFYHSGASVDQFGMIKIVLIEALEFGFLGYCFDLIRYSKSKYIN